MKRSAGFMNRNSSRLGFLRQLMMASAAVCVILLALSGFLQHVASWPASTIQVRVGDDATLRCPLLDRSNATAAPLLDRSNATAAPLLDRSNATAAPLLDRSNATAAPPTSAKAAPTTLSWYRKAAGRGPTLLLSFRPPNGSRVKYGDGVDPDKVSVAADGSLLLRGSEESDSGVYYCGISQGSEQKEPTPHPITGS